MAATLAPLTTPTRQPFGLVTDNKLRQLQSVKNRQNGLTVSSAPSSLKRRAPSPDLSDSENVDPNLPGSIINKRKKAGFDSDVSYSKPSQYSLDVVSKPHVSQSPASATPRLLGTCKTSSTPLSAPPAAATATPAGRSPTKPNRRGLLQPKRKLVVPPAFGIKSAPTLSISAALNGTLAGKKRSKARAATTTTTAPTKPKSWFFDIFEEPEQVQDDRMNEWTLIQGASFLDVSDDEGQGKKEQTDRGKENIDPNQHSAPVTRSKAAAKAAANDPNKDLVAEEGRSPLSDLNPVDYYAPGLDATSVVLVQDESATDAKEAEPSARADVVADNDDAADILATEDIGAVIAASAPVAWGADDQANELPLPLDAGADIEIWESESAKDEYERREGSVDDNVFALQEF